MSSLRGLARAAIHNEATTRERVEKLETAMQHAEGWLVAFSHRTLWGRLRWLLTGR